MYITWPDHVYLWWRCNSIQLQYLPLRICFYNITSLIAIFYVKKLDLIYFYNTLCWWFPPMYSIHSCITWRWLRWPKICYKTHWISDRVKIFCDWWFISLHFIYYYSGMFKMKVRRNLSSGSHAVKCGQTDMTKLTDAFCDYANAPRNWNTCMHCHSKVIHCQ